jgi:heme oxygenase
MAASLCSTHLFQYPASIRTKLVKNAKWLAGKWETRKNILHSFTHLGEQKAEPEAAKGAIDGVQKRLAKAGYAAVQRRPTVILTILPSRHRGSRWQGFTRVLAGL